MAHSELGWKLLFDHQAVHPFTLNLYTIITLFQSTTISIIKSIDNVLCTYISRQMKTKANYLLHRTRWPFVKSSVRIYFSLPYIIFHVLPRGKRTASTAQTVRERRPFVVIAISFTRHASLFWRRYKGWIGMALGFTSVAVHPGAFAFRSGV